MILPVHDIIPFSNVEGIGNRMSIFVQGCNANCIYCHNPETIPMKSEDAKVYTVDELMAVIKGVSPFIRGITVSGGEATLHHKFLTELFKRVHHLGLTCYVDTNGFYDQEQMKDLIQVTDQFLYDVKAIGMSLETLCFSDFLHEGSKLVENHKEKFSRHHKHLENLDHLIELNKIEEVRLVYIKNYYDAYDIIDLLAKRLKTRPHILLKLIRVHVRGLSKERVVKLKGAIPTKADMDKLAAYGQAKGLTNIITIY